MTDIAIPRAAAEPRATVLVLRCCRAGGISTAGFRWPESGPVECPDWSPVAECGHGLHGWLWGAGDIGASNGSHESADARWYVVEVAVADVVDLGGKVKFPRGVVVYSGDRDVAVQMIAARAPAGTVALYGTATAGVRGTATAGYGGTATAGVRGTATAGYGGTATAGDGGTISIEYWCAKRERWRRAIAEVGEGGIEPNTAYVLDGINKFTRKEPKS